MRGMFNTLAVSKGGHFGTGEKYVTQVFTGFGRFGNDFNTVLEVLILVEGLYFW